MEKVIAIMFMSREMAHKAHLKTGNYAQHMALGGFYDSIVDLADGLAEAYQGRYGIMEEIPVMDYKGDMEDPASMLEMHCKMFENASRSISDRYLQNLVDGVTELYMSTVYKLKYLK